MNKKFLFLVILFMTIGIAAVTTNILVNGTANISKNSDDFAISFKNAYVNGVLDNSVITGTRQITFNRVFESIGDSYSIEYTIGNDSLNYDAEVSVNCTESNEYLDITNTLDTSTDIPATLTRIGTLKIVLKKSYVGESEENISIGCTLNVNAVERTAYDGQ